MTVTDTPAKTIDKRLIRRSIFVFIVVVTTLLSFVKLDSTYFWDDEAQVAIIARNFVNTGSLTAWDGRNLFGYNNGSIIDNNLRPINPPMDFLVTAASFRLFGASTWSARAPFVVLGILALLTYWGLLRKLFGEDSTEFIYCFILLALSTGFILTIRNCRYYAPAILFSLQFLYAYYNCISSKHWMYYLLLGVSAALFFYCQYLIAVSYIGALLIAHLLVYRKKFQGSYWLGIGSAVIFLLFTIPYAIRFHIWQRPDLTDAVSNVSRWQFIQYHLSAYLFTGCLSFPVIAILIWQLAANKKWVYGKDAIAWTILLILFVGIMDILLPQPIIAIRYLAPLIPIAALLSGIVLAALDRYMRMIAVFISVLMICCTGLSVTPKEFPGTILLPAYIKELSLPFPTANQVVIDYLSKNVKQNDTITAYPEYMNYPIMYYLNDKIIVTSMLNSSTHLPKQKINQLDQRLFMDIGTPQWFIAYGINNSKDAPMHGTDHFMNYLLNNPANANSKAERYRYNLVQKIDIYYEEIQRPEITSHSFGPITDYNHEYQAVYIYHREPLQTK